MIPDKFLNSRILDWLSLIFWCLSDGNRRLLPGESGA